MLAGWLRFTDPVDRALHQAANAPTGDPVLTEFTFDNLRRRSSLVRHGGDGCYLVVTKGAPEAVLDACTHRLGAADVLPLTAADRAEVFEVADRLATDGGRILAVADAIRATLPPSAADAEAGLCLVGLVALADPP